jgi:hypothetical protein
MAEISGYGKSKKGNFTVVDTIPVPHPYCITPKHVAVASDKHCGILDENAIEDAEREGAKCGICKGELAFGEHKKALLVDCKEDIQKNKELHEYLLKIKKKAEREGYVGFAFKKAMLKKVI